MQPQTAETILHGLTLRTLGLESVGLFWLGAELVILYFVLAGRRHLLASPLQDTLLLNPDEKRRARLWAIVFFLLAALVYSRHGLHLLQSAPIDLQILYTGRTRAHLAIWSAFITGWILLEIVIVYQGWRAYLTLAALLPAPTCSIKPGPAGLVFVFVLLGAAAAQGQTLSSAIQASRLENQVYYNAMYLYLRLAGLAWIAAEWAAAFILWKALVRIRARANGHV